MTSLPLRSIASVLAALVVTALTLVLPQSAHATNPSTASGNRTVACAVSWYAQSDLSHSYSQDYDGDGTISGPETYSNQGYLYEVSSRSAYPAVTGPGDFLIQHFTLGDSALGFRLPVATDHEMRDVTVRIAAESTNLELASTATTLGLDAYHRFDGNPAYTVAAPAPTVTRDASGIVLHWDVLPAGSANIYAFGGTALDGAATNPDNHYLVGASLTGRYVDGAGCDAGVPAVPPLPAEQQCQQVLGGRTVMPVAATDVTVRDKRGEGGETNADGWGSGSTRTLRLYGATDKALTGVTYTATAAQGFTFDPDSIGAVRTASPTGMGQLYGNGYTSAVTGIGTPVISADGRTLTLTVAAMPAHSAFALDVTAVRDTSGTSLVLDAVMVGALDGCTSAAGCTSSQGYWRTHQTAWPAAISPQAPFFGSRRTWGQQVGTGGGGYDALARQYIAARLSIASGASAPDDVREAIAAAEGFFAATVPATRLSSTQRVEATRLTALLESYVVGTTGPGHCG